MKSFRMLRTKKPDGMQAGSGPSFTRIKRFYKKVEIIDHPIMTAVDEDAINYLPKDEPIGLSNLQRIRAGEKYYAIALDGRVIKTMYKNPLPIPSRALAVAVAAEWE